MNIWCYDPKIIVCVYFGAFWICNKMLFYGRLTFHFRNRVMKSDSAIGQHLITNPECAKTYIDDNFRIIGQARSSFHLGVLESVYIKTQNAVLCKQKEFIFTLGLFK